MKIILVRFAKRFAVLAPSIFVAYISIFNIFPWLNDHLPVVFALLITYVLAAYILIPAFIRVMRIIFPPKHLPLYCVTPDGFASDPLNIAILGTRQQIVEAMTKAGWYGADKLTPRTAVRTALSVVYDFAYLTAPMSNLYLFGRKQDLSFQKPDADGSADTRHHVRFWAATFHDTDHWSVESIHWQNREAHIRDDRLLWVGAASRDVGVTFIRHNAQLTHLVDPDTDSERELIVRELKEVKAGKLHRTIKLGKPYKLLNLRGWYRHIHTDGRMKIVELVASSDLVQDKHQKAQ
jgi:hypothetical protein